MIIDKLTLDMLGKRDDNAPPVVIDCYATWCGPCKMFAPIFDRVAAKYADRVDFVKVDTDEQPDFAAHFDVMNVPTLIVIKGGEVVHKSTGILNEPSFVSLIESLL